MRILAGLMICFALAAAIPDPQAGGLFRVRASLCWCGGTVSCGASAGTLPSPNTRDPRQPLQLCLHENTPAAVLPCPSRSQAQGPRHVKEKGVAGELYTRSCTADDDTGHGAVPCPSPSHKTLGVSFCLGQQAEAPRIRFSCGSCSVGTVPSVKLRYAVLGMLLVLLLVVIVVVLLLLVVVAVAVAVVVAEERDIGWVWRDVT
ncbi:hypothetical protein E2C01_039187 [Portunus trituberculatus]|uniref:Uncharacterized protein n=1 Tax=Portunus trituberculatus TaxID=210409 RepID=A0A5B7FJZ6_PORTR|nr:hypothetical protein [Portunus trituberculatus]